jgi:uncharacterized protein YhbP (UPF0306 family)
MTLATTSDNQPWATPVFYANLGFRLYFISNPGTSRHGQNLVANHRVAAAITEDYPLETPGDWRKIKGIQLEGTARVITAEPELAQAVETYVARYPFTAPYLKGIFAFPRITAILEKASRRLKVVPDFSASLQNRFYALIPGRVWFVDNETSFEKRREVLL